MNDKEWLEKQKRDNEAQEKRRKDDEAAHGAQRQREEQAVRDKQDRDSRNNSGW